MNEINRIALPFLILLLVFTSCTVYQEYPIEVYKPGAADIPPQVKDVALVYRNFKYPADTLQHYYKKDFELHKAKNDPGQLDSMMVMHCLNELAQHLKTNTFREVKIIPYNVFKPHSDEKLPPLDFELVEKLTGSTHTDLLISLETFSFFYASYPETYEAIASDEVITAAVWGVYSPETNNPVERKTLIDTVVWHGYDADGNFNPAYKAPPRLTALQTASEMAGENYAKRFYPSWQTTDRTYSIPPLPDFSEAAYQFEEGEWDKAINLWKKYADDRNGKMAIAAQYNIALAYEIKDEIDLALEWLNAARDLAVKLRSRNDLKRIFNYQQKLEQRQKEIQRLNQ
ncbi:MAG: DUF6340 family protein [Prolixibacteraceae bacterium]